MILGKSDNIPSSVNGAEMQCHSTRNQANGNTLSWCDGQSPPPPSAGSSESWKLSQSPKCLSKSASASFSFLFGTLTFWGRTWREISAILNPCSKARWVLVEGCFHPSIKCLQISWFFVLPNTLQSYRTLIWVSPSGVLKIVHNMAMRHTTLGLAFAPKILREAHANGTQWRSIASEGHQ